MNAILAETEVGADGAELLEQEMERRVVGELRGLDGLAEAAVAFVDDFVAGRVELEGRAFGADGNEAEETIGEVVGLLGRGVLAHDVGAVNAYQIGSDFIACSCVWRSRMRCRTDCVWIAAAGEK